MDCDCVQQPDDAYQSKLAHWEMRPVVVLLHRTSEWVTVGVSEPKRSCAMQRDNARPNFAAINTARIMVLKTQFRTFVQI